MTQEQLKLYKTVRYCETCGRNVKPWYGRQMVPVPIYGQMRDISYEVSCCPFCERVLCERGFDEVFMQAVEEEMRRLEQTKNTESGKDVQP